MRVTPGGRNNCRGSAMSPSTASRECNHGRLVTGGVEVPERVGNKRETDNNSSEIMEERWR